MDEKHPLTFFYPWPKGQSVWFGSEEWGFKSLPYNHSDFDAVDWKEKGGNTRSNFSGEIVLRRLLSRSNSVQNLSLQMDQLKPIWYKSCV